MPLPHKSFYLIRHGETEANVTQKMCGGGVDTILTDKGRKQAERLAIPLLSLQIKPTHIIHSDMNRSRDTAALLNSTMQLPMRGNNELREHMFGDWEGQNWLDVKDMLENKVAPPNGESVDDFSTRLRNALGQELENADDQTMPLFVAHGGTFHGLLNMYQQDMLSWIENCQLHLFEPNPDEALSPDFPWLITSFDLHGNILLPRPADICIQAYKKSLIDASKPKPTSRIKGFKPK
jgi:probable phosphoglycerate mutase